jgi:hypothetical protein
MAQIVPLFNGQNVIAGPGMVFTSSRDTALATVTPVVTPAPSVTTFSVSPADAKKINAGDLVCLSSLVNTFLADEASTLSMIKSVVYDGTTNYIVTLVNALGTAPATGSASVKQVWGNRGATKGGIKLTAKRTVADLMCDQSVVAVGTVDKALDIMVDAQLTEATMKNFALAAGLADPAGTGVFSVNGNDPSRTDRVLFGAKAPNNLTRYFVINKAKSQGTATHMADQSNQPIYQYQAKAYVDSSMSPDTLHCVDA